MTDAVRPVNQTIRLLNDNFRTTFLGGQVVMSRAVAELPLDVRARLILAVQAFTEFTKENDPYGEHDCASVVVDGETYLWKVDCYAPDLRSGSEAPDDPDVTRRVLTIMRAEDY
jgi:hypothetical protein